MTLAAALPFGIDRSASPLSRAIVVDATALDTGHRERGIGRYVAGLLSGFAEIATGGQPLPDMVQLRLAKPHASKIQARVAGTQDADESVLPVWGLRRPRSSHLMRWMINEAVLASELGSCRLYHSTEPWALPLSERFPTVATCHDVIPLMFPEHYLNRKHLSWRVYYAALRRAKRWQKIEHVIAISEATKQSIMEYLGVPEERITVVYNGVDHGWSECLPEATALESVRRRYRLERPFFLYLGGYDYRKNIPALVRAFSLVPRRLEVDLVLAGGMTKSQSVAMSRMLASDNLNERVRCLSYVDDPDVPALYALALGFTYLSLAEGFGLQALEAMSLGCPILASNVSSLPEVVGDAGLLVSPMDEEQIAASMQRLFEDSALRQTLAAKGRERAAQFSWRRCADETLSVYRRAL
jgi:glycosyltransferase involved in cell wall biosynthesis